MKNCSKCKLKKDFILFSKNKSQYDGYNNYCKECDKIRKIKRYSFKKEEIKEKSKNYYNENKDIVAFKNKIWRNENKDLIRILSKNYYEKNKEKIKKDKKEYYKNNKVKYNIYSKKRRDNDVLYKYRCNVRTLIRHSFKRGENKKFKKTYSTEKILGCNINFFISYLESKFTEGMTIKNHGEWHIDHIIPISIAKTEEDIIKLCHYTNFQPLWAKENIIKSNKTM